MPQLKPTKVNVLQPGDRFMDSKETAELLSTTEATLNFWRVAGKGPRFYRHGRSVRYLLSNVTEWATSRAVDPERLRA